MVTLSRVELANFISVQFLLNEFSNTLLILTLQYLKDSEESKTGANLKVQDQGYTVDALALPNRTLSIFAEWLKTCVVRRYHDENHTLSVDQFRKCHFKNAFGMRTAKLARKRAPAAPAPAPAAR
ncbi:hypothetical protein EVAR_8358_1 [Eumeta japonica]|uniref:Uncharacterized protein n=1 Tax=Eumeta variegata TaxID=151549 RepID=A0A4C1VFR6_EUMVA|nr:hypothetical protein EVAR_8358_1 [Eumeta japonica]